MIETPCVRVCLIDGGPDGHCIGCFRSVEEIARWTRFTDAERSEIMQALPARRGQISW